MGTKDRSAWERRMEARGNKGWKRVGTKDRSAWERRMAARGNKGMEARWDEGWKREFTEIVGTP